jgi:hypothetical protein
MELVELVKVLYLRRAVARGLKGSGLFYFSDPQKYNSETGVIKLSPRCDKFRMSLDLCDISITTT